MPFDRSKYPDDWEAISARIRYERAGNKCEWCGVENGALGCRDRDGHFWKAQPKGEKLLRLEWPSPGEYWWCRREGYDEPIRGRIVRIVLTVAHLDHDTTHNADENLAALCQRCHLRHDAPLHRANAAATRRAGKALRDLFDERAAEAS